MSMPRVIGSEHIELARQRGLTTLEIFPGDIVTVLAQETATRIGVRLVDGPIDKPYHPRTDGNTSSQRVLYRRSPRWRAPKNTVTSRTAQRFSKLAIIGAGGVGANIAHLAASQNIVDEIALVDITPGLAEACALDLNHASGITQTRARVTGSSDLVQIAGSQVVIVTAGRPRSPGMSRADLVSINTRVIRSIGAVIKTQAPEAVVIVVTNPLDEMTLEMLRCTGFPRSRVLGMAGTLDSSRFRHALARAAAVAPADVQALTLGSHGDEMVPLTSLASIKGQSLDRFLSDELIERCVQDAISGGGQVVALKKTGSATLAPAHACFELLQHMRGARSSYVPVSVMLAGEYGIDDVVVGVPAFIGMNGLINVEILSLTEQELAALQTAANAISQRLISV